MALTPSNVTPLLLFRVSHRYSPFREAPKAKRVFERSGICKMSIGGIKQTRFDRVKLIMAYLQLQFVKRQRILE